MPRSRTQASHDPFAIVREVGRTWSDVSADVKYDGSPVLTVGGAFMAGLATHESAEADSLVVRVDPELRDALLEDAPDIYYLTDYYEPHSVILARLGRMDRAALRDLLGVSRRLTLPKARRAAARPAARARGTRRS